MTDAVATSKALRLKQQRRAAATPYGVAGAARGVNANRREEGGSPGLFSRFLKNIPIINQLVGDDEEEGFTGEEAEEEEAEFYESDDGMESDEVVVEIGVAATPIATTATDVTETRESENDAAVAEKKEEEDEMNQQTEDEEEEEEENNASNVAVETNAAEKTPEQSDSPKKVINDLVNGAPVASAERGATTPSSKAPSTQSSASKSPNFAKRPRSPQSELGPVLRSQRRKNSSTQKAFLPVTSQKSKALRIGGPDSPDDDMRRMNRRRSRLASSPMDSPLAVIKHKKTISYEEYERLSQQLRGLVESSPQASLALTQNALSRGFDERPSGSFGYGQSKNLSYIPGTMTLRDSSRGSSVDQDKKNASEGSNELQLANGATPFGKRARTGENRPIYFSGIALRGQMLTREERVERKPRPSRLLTGAKRDAAARSAYSSAVAEKILSTLNKVQNPLEREAKKPTPQTSLSWAKYHLAIGNGTESAPQEDDEPMDEVAPPTSTIPRVNFPSSFSQSPRHVASLQSFTSSSIETPAPKSKAFGGSTPLVFSPQTVSMTPAPSMHARMAAVKQIAVEQSYGTYAFTLPASSSSIVLQGKRKSIEEDIEDIQFVFSPPPSQREPPKRVSSQKARKVRGAVETPFSFVPVSPKARSEWLGAKPKAEKPAEAVVAKPAGTKTATPAPAISIGANPLAKFAQLAPGSWKCPTCSVTNEAKHAKCPCCETVKPAGSASAATVAAPVVSGIVNPLMKFAQLAPGSWKCPTCSVTNEAKYSKCPCCETSKPGGASISATSSVKAAVKPAGTITSSGFSFGVPAAAPKPVTEAPKNGPSFSFGVAPAEKNDDDASTPSFMFSAPPVSKVSDATKPSFSFGVTSDASITSVSKPSFTFSAPAASTSEDKNVTTTGFSFGIPATSAKKPEESAAKAVTAAPSFSFGSTSSPPVVSKEAAESTPSLGFSFGASTADQPKAPGVTFGVSTKADSESSEPAAKKTAFSFGAIESKPETSVPAFSFGSAPKPAAAPKEASAAPSFSSSSSFSTAKAPESTLPSFTFGSSASASKTDAAEPKPAFAFGATTSQPPAVVKTSEDKPAFAFGSPSAEKPSTEFGQDASSKPSFTFGQSSTASPPKPAAPAPAFGSSAAPAFGSTPAVSTSSPAFGMSPAVSAAASSFGSTSSAPAAPSFTFGTQSSSAAPAATPAATAQPTFTFGASSASTPAPVAASSGFGSTSATTTFGASAPSTTSSTAGPSFTFGAASQSTVQPQSTFGFGASAPSASTGFGVSTTPATSGFGSSAPATSGFGASAPAASGFGAPGASTFGSSAPAASGFGAPSSSTSGFGASATSGFGAPAASGFGATAPASSGFGMSAPAASGFGAAAPAATGFGASTPAQTSFGAPAPGSSGFGAAPASSGFGAAAPAASGFGAASAAPSTTFGASRGFGAGPATGFGAPAQAPGAGAGFGASNQQSSSFGGSSGFGGSTGFGAPAATGFGAAAPSAAQSGFGTPSPVFGGPASAPTSGFGAPSGGFGAGPSASFGAPSVSFGAPAAGFGAPGGFGAPQEGGFNVGAAPVAPKGRRILKARSKRTS